MEGRNTRCWELIELNWHKHVEVGVCFTNMDVDVLIIGCWSWLLLSSSMEEMVRRHDRRREHCGDIDLICWSVGTVLIRKPVDWHPFICLRRSWFLWHVFCHDIQCGPIQSTQSAPEMIPNGHGSGSANAWRLSSALFFFRNSAIDGRAHFRSSHVRVLSCLWWC